MALVSEPVLAVPAYSRPGDLRITDLRVANVVGVPFRSTIIRIDTNQGLIGWGEVRDGASRTYALLLKSRLIGENPCNVDRVFRRIRQFGHHARQAGGVSGVEMALMDLAGKAYGVPGVCTRRGKVPRPDPLLRGTPPTVTTPARWVGPCSLAELSASSS